MTTPASIALADLVQTMAAIDRAYDKRQLTDAEDIQLSKLDDRRNSLERQLVQMVSDQLGIDYGVLWHAVTPTKANKS